MACAHQHATIHRLQREDVSGLHQVTCLGSFRNGYLDGAGAVCGGDACGYAFSGFNRHRKCSAVNRAVLRRHGREFEELATLACQGKANQTAAKTRHEVHGFGRDVVTCKYQVAFVFAVFFVHQNHHAPSFEFGDDFFYWRNNSRRFGY